MIVKTITDESYFYHWLRSTDDRKTQFSYEGANALQAYLDDLSDDIDEPMQFDPIAWCVEYSEYPSVEDAYAEYGPNNDSSENVSRDDMLSYFNDRTSVIELDNGGVILGAF